MLLPRRSDGRESRQRVGDGPVIANAASQIERLLVREERTRRITVGKGHLPDVAESDAQHELITDRTVDRDGFFTESLGRREVASSIGGITEMEKLDACGLGIVQLARNGEGRLPEENGPILVTLPLRHAPALEERLPEQHWTSSACANSSLCRSQRSAATRSL